ncbi:MAG: recombination protein RecR [Parcubacteria group bacterium Athens1014_10]|nr:MAG: recombination protein RecR [Parcubacteria group bacterium Athens1014_10]TSD05465.1 MAG: recombination protein RecR [Parcubacteria group bacterium Athens0714_12]
MYSSPIQNLIDEFNKLPGIGPKTSERFVFYLLKKPKEEVEKFIWAIKCLREKITLCSQCFNFSEKNPCFTCANPKRNHSMICVVAEPQDIAVLEKTKEYQGVYFVLGGLLNSIRGITPEKLRIKQLIKKISLRQPPVKEIILALNPNLEGESTVLYLTKLLKTREIKITRLAQGLPMGSELEYADEVTLSNALKGRREV